MSTIDNSTSQEEAPLPPTSSSVPHSTPRRRPTVSFSEASSKDIRAQLQNFSQGSTSAPPSLAKNAHGVTEEDSVVEGTGAMSSATPPSPAAATATATAPHAPGNSPGRTSSLIRKRGQGSSASYTSTPKISPSSSASKMEEVTNSPFARKRALSKTSPYHASSSPMALYPISPAMLLSGTLPASQYQTDATAVESSTAAGSTSEVSHSAKKERPLSSSDDVHPDGPLATSPPTILRRDTGPGGRSLEIDNEPPTRMRRLTNFLARTYDKYSPSLTLENKGSVARDHLANERTFLAWLRTSLSLITVGVAVTQLFRLQSAGQPGSQPSNSLQISHMGRPLGGSFICLGILFLWIGTSRYFHGQTVMSYGRFPASRGSVILATITVLSVLLACLIVVILDRRN